MYQAIEQFLNTPDIKEVTFEPHDLSLEKVGSPSRITHFLTEAVIKYLTEDDAETVSLVKVGSRVELVFRGQVILTSSLTDVHTEYINKDGESVTALIDYLIDMDDLYLPDAMSIADRLGEELNSEVAKYISEEDSMRYPSLKSWNKFINSIPIRDRAKVAVAKLVELANKYEGTCSKAESLPISVLALKAHIAHDSVETYTLMKRVFNYDSQGTFSQIIYHLKELQQGVLYSNE